MEYRPNKDSRDVITGEELETELKRLRRRDRLKMYVMSGMLVLMTVISGVIYLSADVNPVSAFFSSEDDQLNRQIGYYTTQTVTDGWDDGRGAANVSGGCCGGSGAGAVSGGGCGTGGTSLTDISMSDLEQQALTQYTEETGKSDVQAKAANYGCHIQIDITNAGNEIVRSYGFQGGPLYVIK